MTKVIIILLSCFFLFASSIKLFGWQKKIFHIQLKMFNNYGLNRQLMALVGAIELFGAIAIWFSGAIVGFLGAGALFCTSLGALFFHFRFDSWKDGVPAMITFGLSAIVIGASLT